MGIEGEKLSLAQLSMHDSVTSPEGALRRLGAGAGPGSSKQGQKFMIGKKGTYEEMEGDQMYGVETNQDAASSNYSSPKKFRAVYSQHSSTFMLRPLNDFEEEEPPLNEDQSEESRRRRRSDAEFGPGRGKQVIGKRRLIEP